MKWSLAFHPEKCSAIRVTRAWGPLSAIYTLKGHILQLHQLSWCWASSKHVLEQTYQPDIQEYRQYTRISLPTFEREQRTDENYSLLLHGATCPRLLCNSLEPSHKKLHPEGRDGTTKSCQTRHQ